MAIKPSTYQQVVENASRIVDMLDQLGDLSTLPYSVEEMAKMIEELNDVVLNPPTTGGVENTDEGIKVVGVHVNTANVSVNTTPSTYSQGVTFEFKSTTVIGVSSLPGMGSGNCCVMTVKNDPILSGESTTLATTPFQIAYSLTGVYFYKRNAASTSAWGTWEVQDLGDESRQQIVVSDTQPTDQLEGEYWCEPVPDVVTVEETEEPTE